MSFNALEADVKSSNGIIKFDIDSDQSDEMRLNAVGLGIGVTPSSNLHVNGNATISNQLMIGSSTGSSNLNINGSFGMGSVTVSSNTTLGEYSMVFVDSSSSNLILTLPYAGNYLGSLFNIKRIVTDNEVQVRVSDNTIDSSSYYNLTSGNLGSIKVLSNGINWYILEKHDSVTSAWTPANITTALWLDASDSETVLAGGAGNVYQWNDKSGNDRHATQTTPANQPTTGTAAIAGLNAIVADGGNDSFGTTAFAGNVQENWFIVVRPMSWTDGYKTMIGRSFGTGSGLGIGIATGPNQDWLAGDLLTFLDGWGSGRAPRAIGPMTAGSDTRLLSIQLGDTTSIAEANGTQVSTRVQTTGTSASVGSAIHYIFFNGTNQNIDADMGEIICVHGVLSNADKQRIEGYLAWKWGLEDDLIDSHPYKYVAP